MSGKGLARRVDEIEEAIAQFILATVQTVAKLEARLSVMEDTINEMKGRNVNDSAE